MGGVQKDTALPVMIVNYHTQDVKCIQNSLPVAKPEVNRPTTVTSTNENISQLKWNLNCTILRVWTGFIRLRIEARGEV